MLRRPLESALRAPQQQGVAPWAVVSSALAPVLLVGGFAVARVFQPPTYSPIRQSISVLAGHAANDRWIMNGAVLGVACCTLVTAAGLQAVPRRARVMLVVTGLAGFAVAFDPEPAHGSANGHIVATVVGAILLTIWPAFVGSRRWSQVPVLSVSGSIVVTAVFGALLLWLLVETQAGPLLGVAERAVTGVEVAWPLIVVLAVRSAMSRFHDVTDQRAMLSYSGVGPSASSR